MWGSDSQAGDQEPHTLTTEPAGTPNLIPLLTQTTKGILLQTHLRYT